MFEYYSYYYNYYYYNYYNKVGLNLVSHFLSLIHISISHKNGAPVCIESPDPPSQISIALIISLQYKRSLASFLIHHFFRPFCNNENFHTRLEPLELWRQILI